MTLPGALATVLLADTAATWETIAGHLPPGVGLVGGTALAAHLHHRASRDLDFFFYDDQLDLDELEGTLARLGPYAVTDRSAGALNGLFSETKIQFLSAAGQRRLEPTTEVAGLHVESVGDILAMKLKVIGDRGELRDYFDLMTIEQHGGRTVEQGLGLYIARYDVAPEAHSIQHIVEALGYLEDVDEDELLPASKPEIAAYWQRRQPQVLRNLSRYGPLGG